MNTIQKGILALIKSALTQQPQQLPEGFDLEQAMPVIKNHHITALIFEGAALCGVPRQSPVMQTLFFSYCKSLQVSEGQMRQFQRISKAFEEAGIDYMPLKGCNMKQRYPRPELRMMGDADILIRSEQYHRIEPVMKELGFSFQKETDHELAWTSRELYVELHKRMVPSFNVDLHKRYGDGWQLARKGSGTRYDMTPEDEWVYIFTHFAKHYRDGGIGCRHMADLWVYRRCFPGLDRTWVDREIKKLGLTEFYGNICRLLAVWFEDAPGDEKMDFMTDFIFDSGSYGSDESHTVSRAIRDTRHTLPGVSGRMMYLWKTAFPPVMTLQNKYRILRKCPWLLPVVWLVRPVYKVLFERKTLGAQRRNLAAVSPEQLRTRQDALHYVGLDYDMAR